MPFIRMAVLLPGVKVLKVLSEWHLVPPENSVDFYWGFPVSSVP